MRILAIEFGFWQHKFFASGQKKYSMIFNIKYQHIQEIISFLQ